MIHAKDAVFNQNGETVRMRRLSDGSIQILSLDGTIIIDQISRHALELASNAKLAEDATPECRGIMNGLAMATVFWVGVYGLSQFVLCLLN